MKKIFIILCLISFWGKGYSQKLALNELIALRKQSFNQVKSYLATKKWELESTGSGHLGKDTGRLFKWTCTDSAKGHISMFISAYTLPHLSSNWYVFYAAFVSENNQDIIASMKKSGFVKEKSETDTKNIRTFYSNKKMNTGILAIEREGKAHKLYTFYVFDYSYFESSLPNINTSEM